MILYFHSKGRFAHQTALFATLLANSLKYNRLFFYRNFKYSHFFELGGVADYLTNDNRIKVFFYFLIYKVLKYFGISYAKIFNTEFYIMQDKSKELLFRTQIEQIFRSSSKYVITDYMFNDVSILLEYRQQIQTILKLNKSAEQNILTQIQKLKKTYNNVIALHVRRTDFVEFNDGKYFFSCRQYKKVLDTFFKVSAFDVSKTAIILCSDELMNPNDFGDYIVLCEKRNALDDFLWLKNSDYIIGVPSEFNILSNYLGSNKIYQFKDPEAGYTMDDFLFADALLSGYYDFSPPN
jgi:hypothetical protein